MNLMDGFNRVSDYIEQNLEEKIDYADIAAVFGYSVYHVQRLFAMVVNTPLAEYIRNRRLSRAAVELQGGDKKVIDIALKYGYSSPNSFNHAFRAFHGVSPSDVKKGGVAVKAYPAFSFELAMKGAQTMDYRIEPREAFRVVGRKLTTTMAGRECYTAIPAFWADVLQHGKQGPVLALMNQEPFGLLGISDYSPDFSTGEFNYYIACATDAEAPAGMAEFTVPACTWAVFPCPGDGAQNIEERIVMEWLPTSGYQFGKAPDIERYSEKGVEEVWLPVTQ